MRMSLFISLGLVPSTIAVQDYFEPADFNISEALSENGVDVSTIPELSELKAGPLGGSCSIAVSDCYDHCA
jgi:hypothetical protein